MKNYDSAQFLQDYPIYIVMKMMQMSIFMLFLYYHRSHYIIELYNHKKKSVLEPITVKENLFLTSGANFEKPTKISCILKNNMFNS